MGPPGVPAGAQLAVGRPDKPAYMSEMCEVLDACAYTVYGRRCHDDGEGHWARFGVGVRLLRCAGLLLC